MGTRSGEEPLSLERFARYEALLGPGTWVLREGAWALFGVNAQLLGSGSAAEFRQRVWIEQEAAALREHELAALFLHRPLVRAPGDAGMPTGRYVYDAASQWLLQGPLRAALRLVVSGHTHQALATSGCRPAVS